MKERTSRLLAPLLALAFVCQLGSCTPSDSVSGTGGSTGATGGSPGTGGSGSGSGGQVGTGGAAGQAMNCGGKGGQPFNYAAGEGGSSPYANFSTVQQIVMFKCGGASCHNSGIQDPMFQADANLYTALTTDRAPDCMNYLLVNPGNPMQSAMYLAISDLCPCVPQMPNGCIGGDPTGPYYSCLPPDYIEGVREWISNGAPQQ